MCARYTVTVKHEKTKERFKSSNELERPSVCCMGLT